MTGVRLFFAGFWFTFCALLVPREALAEDGHSSREDARSAAREAFLAASALAQAGDWRGALRDYEAAYRRYPHATTLYNIGYCHAELRDWAAAWHAVARALDDSRLEPELRLTPERRAVALTQRDLVLSKLAIVTLKGYLDELSVDGASLVSTELTELGPFIQGSPAALERESDGDRPLPAGAVLYLNPGVYRLEASRSGRSASMLLELAAGERRSLDLTADFARSPAPAPAPAARPAPSPSPSPPNARVRPPSETAPQPSSLRADEASLRETMVVAGVGALAVGGVGLGTAIVAGVVTFTADSELRDQCDASGACSTRHADTVRRYETAARWTNAGLIAGVSGSLVGLGLLLFAPEEPHGAVVGVSSEGAFLRSSF